LAQFSVTMSSFTGIPRFIAIRSGVLERRGRQPAFSYSITSAIGFYKVKYQGHKAGKTA